LEWLAATVAATLIGALLAGLGAWSRVAWGGWVTTNSLASVRPIGLWQDETGALVAGPGRGTSLMSASLHFGLEMRVERQRSLVGGRESRIVIRTRLSEPAFSSRSRPGAAPSGTLLESLRAIPGAPQEGTEAWLHGIVLRGYGDVMRDEATINGWYEYEPSIGVAASVPGYPNDGTAFRAGLWWGWLVPPIVLLAYAARRSVQIMRLRRHRCFWCGYPCSGDLCPECGVVYDRFGPGAWRSPEGQRSEGSAPGVVDSG